MWVDAIWDPAKEIEIAPGRRLSDLWFPGVRMWNRTLVHARVRATASRACVKRQSIPTISRDCIYNDGPACDSRLTLGDGL